MACAVSGNKTERDGLNGPRSTLIHIGTFSGGLGPYHTTDKAMKYELSGGKAAMAAWRLRGSSATPLLMASEMECIILTNDGVVIQHATTPYRLCDDSHLLSILV
jgi:hypothetical protein